MYRKLLATTALSLVIAGGAYAQDTMQPAPADPMTQAPAAEAPAAESQSDPLVTAAERGISANGWLASEIIGETIYNSSADDAEAIGEVNDFVLDQNGEIGAVVVGVGGFLGIGQKNVAVSWADLELVVGAEDEQRLVAAMTREQLEAAPEFDRGEWLASEQANMDAMNNDPMVDGQTDPMMDPSAPMDSTQPMQPESNMGADADANMDADVDASVEPADPLVPGNELNEDAEAPADAMTDPAASTTMEQADPMTENTGMATDWNTYQPVETSEVSVAELTGTTVYGSGDEDVGAIGDVILSDSGEVEAVIIDFGGFLGIATKPVAVGFDNLTFLRDENGDLVLRTSLTREQLDAAPEYDEEAYLASPDENVMVIQ